MRVSVPNLANKSQLEYSAGPERSELT
jgi:hypothetical protein